MSESTEDMDPKGPCSSIVYTWALKEFFNRTLGPMYVIYRYFGTVAKQMPGFSRGFGGRLIPELIGVARDVLISGKPAFGICLGHQVFAVAREQLNGNDCYHAEVGIGVGEQLVGFVGPVIGERSVPTLPPATVFLISTA